MRPTPLFWREMNMTTPTKISSGDSHDRSNENTTAITLVPTSAPSITASAALVVDQVLADERRDDQAGGGARLHEAGHAEAGEQRAEAVAEAAREDAAQVLAEHAQHAGAHDVRAPHEQGDRGEQVEQVQHRWN